MGWVCNVLTVQCRFESGGQGGWDYTPQSGSLLGFLILLAQLAQASIVDVVIGIVFHTFE
jgi:hypothetical protein